MATFSMQYEDIASLTKAEIAAALGRANPDELKTISLSAALYVDDPNWAQAVCLRLSTHSEPVVRGNAILGLGHLARIHRRLDREVVEPVIRGALSDRDSYVRGQADSAAGDIATFLGWQLRTHGSDGAG
jgi:hypothetical protein